MQIDELLAPIGQCLRMADESANPVGLQNLPIGLKVFHQK